MNLLPPPPAASENDLDIPHLLSVGRPRSDTSSTTSPYSDATAVELDLEDGEEDQSKLTVLLDFGVAKDQGRARYVLLWYASWVSRS